LRVGFDEPGRRALAPYEETLGRAVGATFVDAPGAEMAIARLQVLRDQGVAAAALVSARVGDRDLLRMSRLARGAGTWAPLVLVAGAGDGAVVERAVAERCCDYLLDYDFDADRLVRACRFALEVADRRLAEEGVRTRLSAAEHDLAALLEGIEEGALWIDGSRRVRRWNGRAEAILGRRSETLAGQPFAALGWLEPTAAWAQLASGSSLGGVTLQFQRPDGERRSVAIRALRIPPAEPDGETLRLVLLAEPGEAPSRGLDPRRVGVERMAASIAHNVRNLLTPVLGFAELVRAQVGAGTKVAEHAREVERSARIAAELLQGLLEVTRGPSDSTFAFADAAVAGLLPVLRAVAGGSIRVSAALDASAARIRLRRGDLDQILLNLTTNARDAMPGGGELVLRSRGEAGSWTLDVEDSGPGIADLERVAQPGYTTKRGELASGLGLWIVRGIVEDAGGSVVFANRQPRGARISIRLPEAAPRA
jgi:signal transduction histidine kinase